jgi:hypothetical protein
MRILALALDLEAPLPVADELFVDDRVDRDVFARRPERKRAAVRACALSTGPTAAGRELTTKARVRTIFGFRFGGRPKGEMETVERRVALLLPRPAPFPAGPILGFSRWNSLAATGENEHE